MSGEDSPAASGPPPAWPPYTKVEALPRKVEPQVSYTGWALGNLLGWSGWGVPALKGESGLSDLQASFWHQISMNPKPGALGPDSLRPALRLGGQATAWEGRDGLPGPPPGDFPDSETEPVSPTSCISCISCIAGGFFTAEPPGKPNTIPIGLKYKNCVIAGKSI